MYGKDDYSISAPCFEDARTMIIRSAFNWVKLEKRRYLSYPANWPFNFAFVVARCEIMEDEEFY